MSIARLALVALDCTEPRVLASFYERIVGGHIKEQTASDDWVRLQTDAGCDMGFQRVVNHQPPQWPSGAPQQAHLDFDVPDLESAEAAVLALGAIKASVQPAPAEWRVFIDPAGHPFCLVKR